VNESQNLLCARVLSITLSAGSKIGIFMSKDKAFAPPTPQSIAAYVMRNAAKVKASQKMKMGRHGAESVREADYKGHHIVIRTTYRVVVDGKPIMGHFGVSNNGQVHYHAVPNMAFASAIDVVKTLIDVFPDDFSKKRYGHKGSMGGMAGMSKKRGRK
jgi:hypothetical protein